MGKKFVLSLHYNGTNSYLYVNGKKQYQFTAQDNPSGGDLNLGLLPDGFPLSEKKEVALQGKVFEFSVDFRKILTDDIKNIHTYLMKKHEVNTN